MSALKGLRIIEMASGVADEYCGKLLADFGADVIKIELPGGSPTRHMGPFVRDESALFAYLNTNKKSAVLDPAEAGDQALFHQLLASANGLIEGHDLPWSDARQHEHLVHCCISPFGQSAPAEWQQARAINVINAGGWAYHTPSEAKPDMVPLKGAGRFLPDYEAGIDAALAMLAALLRQRRTEQGQFIDISQMQVQINRADCVLDRMLAGEAEPGPQRGKYDMGGPATVFTCKDGLFYLFMTTTAHWAALLKLMGSPDWAAGFPADWLEFHCTPARVAEFRAHFQPWAAQQLKTAISEQGQKLGLAMVQVNDAADLHHNPQFAHRGFFQRLVHPVLGECTYPTVAYKMSATPVKLTTAAPALGQHDSEVHHANR